MRGVFKLFYPLAEYFQGAFMTFITRWDLGGNPECCRIIAFTDNSGGATLFPDIIGQGFNGG